jgi:chromosomal replication initiation ATPase DnaA
MKNQWNENEVIDFVKQFVISLGFEIEREKNIKDKIKYYQLYGTLARFPKISNKILTIEDVEVIFINFYGIAWETLYSDSGLASVIIFRRSFQYLLNECIGLNYRRIAKHYNCDPRTISTNIKEIKKKMNIDPIFRNEIIELKLMIN